MFRTIQPLDIAAGTSVVAAGVLSWYTGQLGGFCRSIMIILVVTAVVLRLIVPAYRAGAASGSRRRLASVHSMADHRKRANV